MSSSYGIRFTEGEAVSEGVVGGEILEEKTAFTGVSFGATVDEAEKGSAAVAEGEDELVVGTLGGATPVEGGGTAFFGNFFLEAESDFLFRKPGENEKGVVGDEESKDGGEGGMWVVDGKVYGGEEGKEVEVEEIFGPIGDHGKGLSSLKVVDGTSFDNGRLGTV